jgi:hypothetical protein
VPIGDRRPRLASELDRDLVARRIEPPYRDLALPLQDHVVRERRSQLKLLAVSECGLCEGEQQQGGAEHVHSC